MKISILGASGKVAKQAVQQLLLSNTRNDLELTLIARNSSKIQGQLLDIQGVAPFLSQKGICVPKIKVSENIRDISNSDLIVISTGSWPNNDQKLELKQIDTTGRLAQSYANFPAIIETARAIEKFSKNSYILVVTNQSDMMTDLVRRKLGGTKILGMGGMVDSARFRMLCSDYGVKSKTSGDGANYIIGYHNDLMIPLRSSLSNDLNASDILEHLTGTRNFGANVSKLQKDFNNPDINSGASVLPGYAVYATILAFTGQSAPIEEPFNVQLNDELSCIYGVQSNKALSVPVIIKEGSFEIPNHHLVYEDERQYLRFAQDKFYNDLELLYSFFDSRKSEHITSHFSKNGPSGL